MPNTDPANLISPQKEMHPKLQGSELEEVQIPSSSASLPSDNLERTGIAASNEVDTLRSQVQLAAEEYRALEQRYYTLNRMHENLYKLCSAYVDVISGSSSSEEESISIEQLRAEAGRKGMRAKALEADVLKPIIREAGGLHALISQMESIQPLIKRVGGVQELEDLVSETHLCQIGLHEVGGLQGLYNLNAEVKRLKEEQVATRAKLKGPNGLAEKAAKYDKLVQAFRDVQAQREHVAPAGADTMMNPARASLIALMPLEHDPYRDLYEGPPVEKPHNKTGSNKIPLGIPRSREQSKCRSSRQPSVKREPMDAIVMEETTHKRLRTELGHSSALMQIPMTPSHVNEPSNERPQQLVEHETGCKTLMRY